MADEECSLRRMPRERLLESGARLLTDEELVSLVLGSRPRYGNGAVADAAGRLVDSYGGLPGLARAHAAELVRFRGLGLARAASLAAAFELGRRAQQGRLRRGEPFRSSGQVAAHLRLETSALRQEAFHALLLDARHRLLRDVEVSRGSLTASIVHPREVFGPAVREGAAAVVVGHNHPSGEPDPSPEDVELTRRLRGAAEIMGIRLLDHVIVAEERHFSFADSGL